MSEKLRNTPENAIDTEWHKASNERSVEIANSLEKAVEKLPTNIENKDEITHEALEIAASHENRQLETNKTKEPK